MFALSLVLATQAAEIVPYAGEPPPVVLRSDELARLEKGEAVVRIDQTAKDRGNGVAVRDVRAPAEIVWDVLLDYDRYVGRADHVTASSVYAREGPAWSVAMTISILGIDTTLYTINQIHRDQGYMTWTLDPEKDSGVGAMVGYWRVTQIQADPPITRLEHASALLVEGVPSFLAGWLSRNAIVDGTGWVQEVAERTWFRGKE